MNNNNDILNILNILNNLSLSIDETSNFLSSISTFENLCKNYKIDISEERYNEIKSIDSNFDKNINEKLDEVKKYINTYESEVKNNWENYNENYKIYLFDKVKKLNLTFDALKKSKNEVNNENKFKTYYNDCYKKVFDIDTGEDVMHYFTEKDHNYVVFGKNGSGKTTLLNYLNRINKENNIYFMRSNRNIMFNESNRVTDYNDETLRDLFFQSSNNPNLFLVSWISQKDHKELRSNGTTIILNEENIGVTLNTVITIFNSLSTDRKIRLNDSEKLVLYVDGIDEYDISKGSDGERSIIQIIMYVLLCPEYSFVFIDEPENHLNNHLLCELMDILEKEREDIIFIYCTHNIDFIESRSNCDIILLNKYKGNGNNNYSWDMEKVNNVGDIPIQMISEIIGSKKNILLIEGEKGSYDYKLYSALFNNYVILSASSCANVIKFCKSLSESNQSYLLGRKIYGIVDNDFRSEEEINELENCKINVLKYSEIENVLLCPLITDKISEHIGEYNIKENLEDKVIELTKQNRDVIIRDYINKLLPRMIKSSKINDISEDIKGQIKNVVENCMSEVEVKLSNFISTLDDDIKKSDYSRIIERYPNKALVNVISKTMEMNKNLYIKILTKKIKDDDKFKNQIINEIFINNVIES